MSRWWESDKVLGGACVHRGTIPSKTLRENALRIAGLRHHAELFSFSLRQDMEMAALIANMNQVIDAHDQYINRQISRNRIQRILGRASFIDRHQIQVASPARRCRYTDCRLFCDLHRFGAATGTEH